MSGGASHLDLYNPQQAMAGLLASSRNPAELAMVTLPTAEELNPYDDLDGRVACRHFLGKSLAEAEALFRENEIYYQEDLMWMGAKAFCFYVQAR